MLSNIITTRTLRHFYRLVKPSISEFNSVEDLEYELKQRQIAMIDKINQDTMNENKSFTHHKFIAQLLNTSHELTQAIAQKHLNFTGVSPATLKSHTLKLNLGTRKIEYPFSLEQLETALPDLNAIPMHFSYNRGVPLIEEYEIDKKIAYVFNLPDQFNIKEISQKLGVQSVKQIKLEYCRLGLPAYAKVYFNTDQVVNNLVLNNKTYIEIGGRLCYVKTHFDKEKLQLKNRRLVIHDLQQSEEDLILQLTQYGRIAHFDYPTFISRNPSLEQVREKYKKYDHLIKINHHRKNGSMQSEFYPSIEETFRMNTLNTSTEFDANMVEKKAKLEAMYKNRMRYAQEIDVYEGKQNQIQAKNMGYCIVTFTCSEEAQNCYFNMRFNNKIQLFDAKTTEEFEVDQGYRKRILRLIDSEYQKAKELKENNQTVFDKEYEELLDSLSLFDRLVELQTHEEILREEANEDFEGEPEALVSYFKTRVREIKQNLQKKVGSKSFGELAELELFGRVLPKHDPKKPKLALEVMDQTVPEKQELFKERLDVITSKSIKARDTYYRKKKSREVKRMGMETDKFQNLQGLQGDAEVEGVEEPIDTGDDYSGQRNFSTQKKRSNAFRNRNAVEMANYILHYCEYIRSVINEYQGVFAESRFSYNQNGTFLNPESLEFSDRSSFVTEDEVPKFLECMRTFNEAQKTYTDFWKDYEYFKSRNINLNEYLYSVRNKAVEGLKRLYDNGCVKEVYEVEAGDSVEKKVLTLNATVASFGEEFKSHVDGNGNKIIIKVAKAENICPLDRMAVISKEKARFNATHKPTQKQLELFQKYKYQVIETGEIPDEVRKQFGIPADKTLDDLFQELASDAGIYKKDIQMILNLQNFTEEQIAVDKGLQLQMQKARMAEKQSKASDYAKDPNNIEVRDKEGYFKVSKFRQI